MRDWIGTGVSLLGFVVVVVAVVNIVRLKAYRPSEHVVARGMAAPRGLLGLSAGLLTVECGQLIRTHDRLWALLHAVIIGVVAVGMVLLHRDVRRARRLR